MTKEYWRKAPDLLHQPAERVTIDDLTDFYSKESELASGGQKELLEGWYKRETALAMLGNNAGQYTDELINGACTLADAALEHFSRAADQLGNQKGAQVNHIIQAQLALADTPLFDARLNSDTPGPDVLKQVHANKVEVGAIAVAYFNERQNKDRKTAAAQALGHALLSRTQDFLYTPYTASTRERKGFAHVYFPPRESGLSIRARFLFERKNVKKMDQTILLLSIARALSTNVLPASVHGRASTKDFRPLNKGIQEGFEDLQTEIETGAASEVVQRTTQHFMEIINYYDGIHTDMHKKKDFYWPELKLSDEDWANGHHRES